MRVAVTNMYNKTSMPRWTATARVCITKPTMSPLELDDTRKMSQLANSRLLRRLYDGDHRV
jgi:hypothetical protein